MRTVASVYGAPARLSELSGWRLKSDAFLKQCCWHVNQHLFIKLKYENLILQKHLISSSFLVWLTKHSQHGRQTQPGYSQTVFALNLLKPLIFMCTLDVHRALWFCRYYVVLKFCFIMKTVFRILCKLVHHWKRLSCSFCFIPATLLTFYFNKYLFHRIL